MPGIRGWAQDPSKAEFEKYRQAAHYRQYETNLFGLIRFAFRIIAARRVDIVLTGNARPPSAILAYATRVKPTLNAEAKNPRRNVDTQMERMTGRARSCNIDNVCSCLGSSSSASLVIATDDDGEEVCAVGPVRVGSVYEAEVSNNHNPMHHNLVTDLVQ